MIPLHGIPEQTLTRIAQVLSHFAEVDEAILFGSRAKATHKLGSDIDLALSGGLLNWRVVGRIYEALDDLLLPYRFSLIVLDGNTDPEVAAHIERVGVPIYCCTAPVG